MTGMDAVFQAIVDDKSPSKGAFRITVLEKPTNAQLLAVPIGSDVIFSDDKTFMAGQWTEDIRDSMAAAADDNDCHHLHAFIAYLPPAVTEDSQLTAEQITDYVMDLHGITPEHGLNRLATKVIKRMLKRAVHMARDGMVFKPF